MSGQLVKWITHITRRCQRDLAERLAPLGIGMGTHGVLLHTCKHPGISQDELAEHALLNKSTVARAVAQLEEDGFVTRERNEHDRRVFRVYPTDKALGCTEQILACTRECQQMLTAPLDEEEAAQLARLLEKIYRHGVPACEARTQLPATRTSPGKREEMPR